ncbi:transmembrane channel-like protein 7 [Nephila pilipes]|uniref:Transmembrane channel-like protein 7 n=1 Tax=Nephila pilipes TaxID=299642 RepID=A0A8X6PE62_NEPPI|nr:transmembrane channel-like protein 7 [Nephila pilipes]
MIAVTKTEINTVNAEDKKSEDKENILHFLSTALASQIKKIAPSINVCDKQVTIVPGAKETSSHLLRSRSSSTTASQVKVVQFGAVRKLSIIPEIEYDDTPTLESEEATEEVIDEAVKKIPVPMEIKRQRRNSIMISIKRIPWYKKWPNRIIFFFKDLFSYRLWEKHIKVIEGRFGVAVVSFFLFLRWLLYLNILILSINLVFLVLPQFFISPPERDSLSYETVNISEDQKYFLLNRVRGDQEFIVQEEEPLEMYREVSSKERFLLSTLKPQFVLSQVDSDESKNLSKIIKYCQEQYRVEYNKMKFSGFFASIQAFLQGTGWLESTLLFIGSYKKEVNVFGHIYNVPSAFLWVFIISFVLCLIMMVRYSSFGIREAFLTRHQTVYFGTEIFSAWNYCIRTQEAASLLHDSFVVELKSELSEARRRKELKERSFLTWAKIYSIRFLINAVVLLWIVGCYILIHIVTLYQLEQLRKKKLRESGLRTLLIQYLPPITVTTVAMGSPFVFKFLVHFEKYHGQTAVNISIIRNAFLSLSSIIVLVLAIHREITCAPKDICGAGKSQDCKSPRCWETYVGQQLYRLSLIRLFVILATFILVTVPREYIMRYWNNKCTRLVGHAIFSLPTEVLVPIYAQTIVCIRPSLGCTPFSHFELILYALKEVFSFFQFDIVFLFMFILSGWFFIPSSIILCTIIYYYSKYLTFLKNMEENLKTELTILGRDKKFILHRIETLAKNL